MAVSKVKCLRIIGVTEHLNEAVSVLRSTHSFHPDDPFSFYSDTQQFFPVQVENPYGETIEKFKASLAANGLICKKVDVCRGDFSQEKIINYVDEKSRRLTEFAERQSHLRQEIETCRQNIEQIKHFLGLNLDIDKINECRYVKAHFGRLPKESYEKLGEYKNKPFLMFFPCSSDDEYYWGLYMSPISNNEVDRIFSGLYFENYNFLDLSGTPEHFYDEEQKRLPMLQAELEALENEIRGFVDTEQYNLNLYYSVLDDIRQDYDLMSKAASYKNSFILIGWVPSSMAKKISEELNAVESVECTLTDGSKEIKHSPPVKLKNNALTRGFEFYTEMYGLPNYREFDPTTFIAITYTILFGIMFGDVGHGLMVLLAGIIMKKKLKMPIGSILIPCGISGTVFGFIYGSVCGFEHLLDPLYKVLFGLDEKPISVMEPAMTNNIIYIAVGIGFALVTVAIILGIISSFKMKDLESAIFGNNGICGLIFYVSLAVGLVCQILLGITVLTPLYITVLIVIPLLLIFLREPLGRLVQGKKDWQPEKWGEYCVQNFFELFEVLLSYVTNTMSFLRVGAFVLVHAGMMEVVFTLANMATGVGYVAIVVIGNIFVMALEALLVCIQVLRLEFYEMFGRFYKGDGRAFIPVGAVDE